MTKNLPSVSFIVVTLDAMKFLPTCLGPITKQNYPKSKIEIILSDGGSTDGTRKTAQKYGARIINNKQVLAEPGVNLGLLKAKNEICFILAADNEIKGRDWLVKMVKPFVDPEVVAAFPKQVNAKKNNWLTKYVNVFTDPFDHFVYGNAANSRTFHRVYKVLKKTKDYVIYDYTIENHPILALAQGFGVRKGFKRDKGMEYDDMAPIMKMITHKKKIAYVYSAGLYHHTIRDFTHFIKKNRWAIDNSLTGKSFGLNTRAKYLSLSRKIKVYFWPFYAISLIFPLLNSFRGVIVDKEWLWLYHPVVSFIVAWIALTEFVKIKILGGKLNLKGKPS